MRLGAVPRNLAGTSQDSGSVLFPHIGIAWLMIEGPWLDPADFLVFVTLLCLVATISGEWVM